MIEYPVIISLLPGSFMGYEWLKYWNRLIPEDVHTTKINNNVIVYTMKICAS